MIKVLIADDHGIVRTGLRTLISSEPNMELVGEATGGYEAMDLVEKLQPDVLVLDLSMPDIDGITVTKTLQQNFPNLHILILTIHEDGALLRAALKAGAHGYILKQAAESELISAINVLLRGDIYVDPPMVRSLLNDDRAATSQARGSAEVLTPRENEVLRLIVQGYTNRQIGEQLHISVRTVEGHRNNLSEKLGLHSRVELVRYAREHKLVD